MEKIRHLLTLSDLSRDELLELLNNACQMKVNWFKGVRPRHLVDKSVALIFEKPSTRTRVSFEVGVAQLGGHPLFMAAADSQLSRSEPGRDTARVLSRYVDAIVIRTFGQETIEELARFSGIPVINALTDTHHPCQVLSDLMTVSEHFGKIEGLKYCWLGDGNNMANSWIEAAGILGLDLSLACPAGFEPDAAILKAACALGGNITLTTSPRDAIKGCDVVSTDVWASMGQEKEASMRKEIFWPYRLDEALLAEANKRAVVLHCLPAHRDEEISEGVLEGPQALVWQEAENRLHLQKALLAFVLDKRV